MILKDGSEVPDGKVEEIMTELRRCTRGTRRMLRPGAYGKEVPRAVLLAHPVLLHKDRLSVQAVIVIACAVQPDGSLVHPGNNT